MEHHFDIDHAQKYGVDEAVLINHFRFWILTNQRNNHNFRDGRWWSWTSRRALLAFFPYWNDGKIKRVLESLIEKNVLLKGNYNDTAYDRTNWYSFQNEPEFLDQSIVEKEPMDWSKTTNGLDESDQPIPDIKPVNKPDIKSKSYPPDSEPYRLAVLLRKEHLALDPQYLPEGAQTEKVLQGWAAEIDKLIRVNKRDAKEIAKVIHWVKHDHHPNGDPPGSSWRGWASVIMSGDNLRKKYDTILPKIKSNGSISRGENSNVQPGTPAYDLLSKAANRKARGPDS